MKLATLKNRGTEEAYVLGPAGFVPVSAVAQLIGGTWWVDVLGLIQQHL